MKYFKQSNFFILLFAMILLVPSLGGFVVQPDVSVENRGLTPFPELSSISALKDLEPYLTDRIAFRAQMIQASSYIDYFLFKKSLIPNVVIGKNGQLFYNEKNELIDTNEYLLGNSQVSEEQLDAIVQVQKEIQQQMDDRGIQYLIVVAPTKQAIYPEDLPEYYKDVEGYSTPKEQILDRLRSETSISILDLTDALLEEKALHPVYLKTDSHWNYFGSFRGYEEIVSFLKNTYPEIPLLPRDMFTYSTAPEYDQNLSKMLSLGNILADDYAVRFMPEIPLADQITDIAGSRQYPDPNYASPEFKMIITEQKSKENLPSALMYRDSFAGLDGWTIGNLNRYLATAFSTFVSYTQYQIDFNYIDTEKPDIVILEVYEDNIFRLGINYLNPGEVTADKALYGFNTELNGEYYIPDAQ